MKTIVPKRRRGTTKPMRLNLYLTPETVRRVEAIAQLRGIENGPAARELLEERLAQLVGAESNDSQQRSA